MPGDLHRHDEFSTFDGFGKAKELAMLAKEKGHTFLGTSNHGNTNGLVQTYKACKEVGIKPVLGVEGYFLPKYKEKERGFHLCLFAKDLQGYRNLNEIQYEGEKQKYYNPIWDFNLIEKYHDGLICTSACVASYSSQCIIKGDLQKAEKYLKKMKSIFEDDFYIEIQPYKISEEGVQEKINVELIKLARKLDIKCILTSDSHRGGKEDIETYIKMHEIANHDRKWIEGTYSERYMPDDMEMEKRFLQMHKKDFGVKDTKKMALQMRKNLHELEEKVNEDILSGLNLMLPTLDGDSDKILLDKIKKGLKERGKNTKEYINRAKEEYEVITYHGFSDYFLIVADYVNWAKEQGIAVGPGRGSVCNSIVAYALRITEVDSILFDLDFRRFLRKDKKKFPDIDLDFETSRRYEVIQYLCNKYRGHAARICSYGLYKIDNLINDLAKVCGLPTSGKDVDENVDVKYNKQVIVNIKKIAKSYIDENGQLDKENLLKDAQVEIYNDKYDNIFVHFSKLFMKVRYIGTHAAGVAITGGNILDYVALRVDKAGDIYTNYDLSDIEDINIIKFDILGLKTEESIANLRKQTGVTVDYDKIANDKKLLSELRNGNCDGIFQLESNTVKDILRKINCDCFMDVVAATSMNRPGPLKLKMPEAYAENKMNVEEAKNSKYWEYTKDSYGAIIYQEQLMQICVNIGQMSWSDSDKILKLMKNGEEQARNTLQKAREKSKDDDLEAKFINGAMKSGLSKDEAKNLFNNMLVYSFVKGHGTGYSLISMEEMFYKVYYPTEYWFSKLKFAGTDEDYNKFCAKAVLDGAVIFLPHVNYSTIKTKLRKVDGEKCLQQGLADIKNVGEKAAQYICEERKQNGIFTSFDDFYDRCKSRVVTSRVIDTLKVQGALEFNKKVYISRVTKYNSALYVRGTR